MLVLLVLSGVAVGGNCLMVDVRLSGVAVAVCCWFLVIQGQLSGVAVAGCC